jgi:HAD superfamily phosphoserine phosphatase-like hydrolase
MIVALCDFNGTIVDRDMLDYLAAFADAKHGCARSSDRGYRSEIARRARAVRFDRDEAERRIEEGLKFDETFPDFQRACENAGVELVILTSGIEELVERYLARRGMHVPVIGNAAEFGTSGWRMHFRDESPAGIDKRAYVERALTRGAKAIVIGDDRSDFEAALAANIVYAKSGSELESFLSGKRTFRPFRQFADILARWPPAQW